ncbi:hypothetical protein Y032_0025g1119 [Ancylostoma ceylanicum]|uniref:Uncharacterized protein n=1 Tax=Ancylostoma ceylanicum TaxID=53326 RepID=A0A016UX25_9BILA|nr:hypothetical protein Y032_0025g1119 [Ancylostoma ceylanicum]
MTSIFFIFNLRPESARAVFHFWILSWSSSLESAINVTSSAQSSVNGGPSKRFCTTMSSVIMKRNGLIADPWCNPCYI